MKNAVFTANVDLMTDFVSRTVIHRLNNPKREAGGVSSQDLAKLTPAARAGALARLRKASLTGKARQPLSPEDEKDVRQITAAVLTVTGAFETRTIPPGAWTSIFRHCRASLGMNRKAKPANNGEKLISDLSAPLIDIEADASRRQALARHVRYLRGCLYAHFQASNSRKRRAAYRGHVLTLSRIMSGTLRHRGMTQGEIDATGKRVSRMMDAVREGENILTREAEEQAAANSRPRRYVPLESFTPRALPAKQRPFLESILGFNP